MGGDGPFPAQLNLLLDGRYGYLGGQSSVGSDAYSSLEISATGRVGVESLRLMPTDVDPVMGKSQISKDQISNP